MAGCRKHRRRPQADFRIPVARRRGKSRAGKAESNGPMQVTRALSESMSALFHHPNATFPEVHMLVCAAVSLPAAEHSDPGFTRKD